MSTKQKIIDVLFKIPRGGINDLLAHLEASGFFTSPASTKYHGCYEGGLADHSWDVYSRVLEMNKTLDLGQARDAGQKPLPLTDDNIAIACLLHDLCKVGAYLGTEKPYAWNKQQPKGHAVLSIVRANGFIALEPIEEMMIRFHMGVYGLNEFFGPGDWGTGEYPLRGDIACDGMSKDESKAFRYGKSLANAWYHNPICKIVYFADEIATMTEKASESK